MDYPTMKSESKENCFNAQKIKFDCIFSVTGRIHSQVINKGVDEWIVSGKGKIFLLQLFRFNEFIQGALIKGDFCSFCRKEYAAAQTLRQSTVIQDFVLKVEIKKAIRGWSKFDAWKHVAEIQGTNVCLAKGVLNSLNYRMSDSLCGFCTGIDQTKIHCGSL